VEISDLAEVSVVAATEGVTRGLSWGVLTDDAFERLIFTLIGSTPGYEKPQWLTKTRAPDRGRDMSVVLVEVDRLSGDRRRRWIIQCKHWQSKRVKATDVGDVVSQMKLWEPPRVDGLVIATSGRFSADSVSYVERHNLGDNALWIEMWPDSHLERLLAARPDLTAEFGLRRAIE
jgi:hypothetical protein